MPAIDTQYEDLLRKVLTTGVSKSDRTGTGTRSLFTEMLRYDLQKGFPLITTKRIHLKSVVGELIWFLRGEGNTAWLKEHGITIWNEWADEQGNLGPVYGVQWRSWPTPDGDTIDQIADAIERLKRDPDSRRHVVSAWNVAQLQYMALSPCHIMFQFYVADGKLSCTLYQRSCDMLLGVPFNIASYALLTHMIAQQTGLQVGMFNWIGGDLHIYDNHVPFVEEQLTRDARGFPTLVLKQAPSIDGYAIEDVSVEGYDPHPNFKGVPIAV